MPQDEDVELDYGGQEMPGQTHDDEEEAGDDEETESDGDGDGDGDDDDDEYLPFWRLMPKGE